MTIPHRGFQCHAINIQINIQIKHNCFKNPNWPEVSQLAIYKCGRGYETKIFCGTNPANREGLELGSSGLQVQRSNRSATLPSPLHFYLPSNLPTYLPTYLPKHLPTYQPTHLPTYQPTHLPTYLDKHLPTYLPTNTPCLSTHLPTYTPTYIFLQRTRHFHFLTCCFCTCFNICEMHL